ncbi:hypothetical protein OAF27_01900 [Verrucomicrobiales bacterium]|nr:hypothetical protein [Verrucomicrobiales bacterium]
MHLKELYPVAQESVVEPVTIKNTAEKQNRVFVVTTAELQSDLTAALRKILKLELNIDLPKSAEVINGIRPRSFRMSPRDARWLIDEMTKIIKNIRTRNGGWTYDSNKWAEVTIGETQKKLEYQRPGLTTGSYVIIKFAPKVDFKVSDKPAYQFRINPTNGYAVFDFSDYD